MRMKTMVEEATAHQGISAGSGRAASIKPSRGAGHPRTHQALLGKHRGYAAM